MTRTALIISHAATLLVGAAAVYFVVPLQPGGNERAGEGTNGATTFSGSTSPTGGSSSATPNPGSLSAIGLEQSGYRSGFEDPLAGIKAANDIAGRDNRLIYTESLFTAWGEKNGSEAAAWVVANLKGTEKSDALYNVADGWAETDPEAAAKWFDENTNGINREDAIYEILEAWGRQAPEAALAWAADLDEYTRSGVMDALAEGWAANDPARAAQAVEGLLQYDFGDEFAMNVAGQWASTDPVAAAEWAATLENSDARAISLLEIGTEWAMTEPGDATAWIASLQSEDDKMYASLGVALGWSEHDPGAALAWSAASVDDPNTRQRIIEDIMLDWSSNDPASAAAWLNAQPAGPENDEILSAFSGSIVDIDPESAVTWASTISDETRRQVEVTTILEEWIALDGERARQWVADSDLSPDLKSRYGSAP